LDETGFDEMVIIFGILKIFRTHKIAKS